MHLKAIVFSFWVFLLASCTTPNKISSANQKDPILLKAVQTPLIRGAGGLKGKKITLKLEINKLITIDSIQYEKFVQPVHILNKSNDTIWVEAFFYPASISKGNENNQNKAFVSNNCLLYFHTPNESGKLAIKEMENKSDLTKWQ